MAKCPRCLSSLVLACALFCFFRLDASRTFVSSGMRPASPPQHPKVSSEAYGGGSGGGGYGGGSSGQANQFGSTLLLCGLIGGLMYVAFTTLEGAESRGWNAPTYKAPGAAPAEFQKDRATVKEEAIRQIMADGAARLNPDDFSTDRFRTLKAAPRVESGLPEEGTPSSFPSLQRTPMNTAAINSQRNLLPERYGNSARPINSAF